MRSLLIFLAALLLCAPAQAQVSGGAYDSDAQVYFDVLVANSCTTPTPAFKLAVSHYVQAEKVAGNWNSQDAEYILATANSCTASINLAQPTLYKVTYSGSPAFTVQNGMPCDGATQVGDTDVNQSALTRETLNNGHIEAWSTSITGARALGIIASAQTRVFPASASKRPSLNSTTQIDRTGAFPAALEFRGSRLASTASQHRQQWRCANIGGAATSAALARMLI